MADGYIVTSISQTSEISPTGHLTPMFEIHYEFSEGAGSGFVRVPSTGDWETKARALIEANVAQMSSLLGQ